MSQQDSEQTREELIDRFIDAFNRASDFPPELTYPTMESNVGRAHGEPAGEKSGSTLGGDRDGMDVDESNTNVPDEREDLASERSGSALGSDREGVDVNESNTDMPDRHEEPAGEKSGSTVGDGGEGMDVDDNTDSPDKHEKPAGEKSGSMLVDYEEYFDTDDEDADKLDQGEEHEKPGSGKSSSMLVDYEEYIDTDDEFADKLDQGEEHEKLGGGKSSSTLGDHEDDIDTDDEFAEGSGYGQTYEDWISKKIMDDYEEDEDIDSPDHREKDEDLVSEKSDPDSVYEVPGPDVSDGDEDSDLEILGVKKLTGGNSGRGFKGTGSATRNNRVKKNFGAKSGNASKKRKAVNDGRDGKSKSRKQMKANDDDDIEEEERETSNQKALTKTPSAKLRPYSRTNEDGKYYSRTGAYRAFAKALDDPIHFPFGPTLAMTIGMLNHVDGHNMANLPNAIKAKWQYFCEQHPMVAGNLEQNLLDCRCVDGFCYDPGSDDAALKYNNAIRLEVRSLASSEKCDADAHSIRKPPAVRQRKADPRRPTPQELTADRKRAKAAKDAAAKAEVQAVKDAKKNAKAAKGVKAKK
ncbi:hypothetical protein F4680DRAFT_471099 [Xylaria scruposa]|nr:hypothetical protein F4680DRAFT_471099 [Xylaria scruposa]